jgi:hypothetical protein
MLDKEATKQNSSCVETFFGRHCPDFGISEVLFGRL